MATAVNDGSATMNKALWWNVFVDNIPHLLVLTAMNEGIARREAQKLLSTLEPERVTVKLHRWNEEED